MKGVVMMMRINVDQPRISQHFDIWRRIFRNAYRFMNGLDCRYFDDKKSGNIVIMYFHICYNVVIYITLELFIGGIVLKNLWSRIFMIFLCYYLYTISILTVLYCIHYVWYSYYNIGAIYQWWKSKLIKTSINPYPGSKSIGQPHYLISSPILKFSKHVH